MVKATLLAICAVALLTRGALTPEPLWISLGIVCLFVAIWIIPPRGERSQ